MLEQQGRGTVFPGELWHALHWRGGRGAWGRRDRVALEVLPSPATLLPGTWRIRRVKSLGCFMGAGGRAVQVLSQLAGRGLCGWRWRLNFHPK